jgi:hypothetical protein
VLLYLRMGSLPWHERRHCRYLLLELAKVLLALFHLRGVVKLPLLMGVWVFANLSLSTATPVRQTGSLGEVMD